MDYAILKVKVAEVLAANPGWTDQQIADSLNAKTLTRDKASLSASEVFNAVVVSEYNALSTANKALIWDILHMGTLNPFGREAEIFTTAFGANSATITALKAARVTAESWAESVGLPLVGSHHVAYARSL